MSEAVSLEERSLRFAVVGSGPSGFYAAEELLQLPGCVEVNMLERLPVPYGLVRSGVAPDHPKLKQPAMIFAGIARDPRFRFFGNVALGRDVLLDELLETHHAVVIATGASVDNRLGIPGESLPGCHSATDFVSWYNGHPDQRDLTFDLSQETAAIIGQGNVALDVARILCKPVSALRTTDIAAHALDALAASRIREVHVFGRRGPVQAKFTPQELGEFGNIEGCSAYVEPAQLELDAMCAQDLTDKRNRNAVRNLELFRSFASPGANGGRRCVFHFNRSPVNIHGTSHVEAVEFAHMRLEGATFERVAVPAGPTECFECGLVFRSVGYRGVAIDGLAFDERRGTLKHEQGRLFSPDGATLPGAYTTGWIKRGASGIIGTNRADSIATVASLVADLPTLSQRRTAGSAALANVLQRRKVVWVDQAQWHRIDESEVARGLRSGKPREKFTRVDEMMATARGDQLLS